MGKDNKVRYREVQRLQQVWAWLLILLSTFYMWYWFIRQVIFDIPVGDNPASDTFTIIFWIIFGVILPVLTFVVMKLITEVRNDGIYIRFIPFHFKYKSFLFKDIRQYESITSNPLKEFGGWGIRFNFKGETAYNLNGKGGVKLKLKYDTVIIGTRKPDELKKAMDSAQNET